jgi:hypothetical protein
MAADPARIPFTTALLVVAAGANIDLTRVYGSLYIRNSGLNPCWLVFGVGGAAPGNPPASDGTNRIQIPAGGCLNLDDIAVRWITAITAGALATVLQIVAVDRPGNSGYGAG